MNSNELVSVIVPTKNSEEFLEACLKSVKAQSYKNIELIVVDNSSEDTTAAIARKYADKFYVRGPERSAQRNYGVGKSSGKYVAIIDSDMKLGRDVIAQCLDAVHDKSKSKAVIIPEESTGNSFWAKCKRLERSFYIGVNGIEAARFYDKSLYLKLKGYNEKLVSGEDWDLSNRASKYTHINRVNAIIIHNEGYLKLRSLLQKKYYYACHYSDYLATNDTGLFTPSNTGPISRYKLFLSHPLKTFRHPIIGMGMLFMKTCEFGIGALGYITGKLNRKGYNRA